MRHSLSGYAIARAERLIDRFIIVEEQDDATLFYLGGGEFNTERDVAIRYQRRPHQVLAQFPTARVERA